MNKISQLALLFAFFMTVTAPVDAQAWTADLGHSSVQFTVRHIVTPFMGYFETFEVDVVFDENDLKNASITASLDPASVNTFSDGRDDFLKAEGFFGVEEHPDHWTFTSTSIKKTGEGEFVAKGKMTAKGTTLKMEIPFKYMGTMETRFGLKSGITAEFSILRSDFGLGDEVGGMVGDKVRMVALLELDSKK